ncbi:MAG: hypothetical protein A2020_10390 [Lentisphaerae bacterium GWF2_45_14]|nr:MAG: hypothetical protein A2020_10390 [Lentisphaerae bacterium GWF2_45_14]
MKFEIKEFSVQKRLLICSVILIFGILCMSGLRMLRKKPADKAEEELLRTVFVQEVVPETVNLKISGYGTVKPRNQVTISSEIKGKIVQIDPDLKAGRTVEKDEILAKIDDSDYKINLETTAAEIERLEGEKKISVQTLEDLKSQLKNVENILTLEKKEYERSKLLHKKNVTNESDLNRAAQTYASREKEFIDMRSRIATEGVRQKTISAQIRKATEEQKMAELNMKRSTIKSPFSGRLKEVLIEKDEYVGAGTKLFTIVNDKDLEITVPLDSFDAVKALGIKNGSGNNWFSVPENIGLVIEWAENPESCCWEGRVVRLEAFNPETRTLDIVVKPEKNISASKHDFPLVDGMFCKVTFTGIRLENAIRVPWVSLQHEKDVFVVGKDNRLMEKEIKVFMAEGESLIITSGLEKGDRIVTQRLPSGLVNGSKVNPFLKK